MSHSPNSHFPLIPSSSPPFLASFTCMSDWKELPVSGRERKEGAETWSRCSLPWEYGLFRVVCHQGPLAGAVNLMKFD